MYVIYINDRPLTLLSGEEHRTRVRAQKNSSENSHLVALYIGKPRTLLNYADMLEKGSPKVLSVDLVAEDVEQLWRDFQTHYKWVAAAGGVVKNKHLNKHLFIYRRGFWDLPKGKIDEGESIAEAALREVAEETGVADLKLGDALSTTYHTYRNRKEKRVLKPTYWFNMETNQELLVPQKEEDIELAEWRGIQEVLNAGDALYNNLRFLLESIP